jgi:uncharacterized membrane protein YkoI
MREHVLRSLTPVALVALASVVTAQAGQIPKDKVPAPVVQAFAKSYPNAVVKAYSVENEHGKLLFEVESMDGASSRDVTYAADGTMVEMEEGMQPSDLPEAVAKAVALKYPKGRVVKAERLTRGQLVGYEIKISSGGKKVEMTLDANGLAPQPAKPQTHS